MSGTMASGATTSNAKHRQKWPIVHKCGQQGRGKHSVKEFPGVRSIETPDDYRLQERWFEIT